LLWEAVAARLDVGGGGIGLTRGLVMGIFVLVQTRG
jgi:hypothetical protein